MHWIFITSTQKLYQNKSINNITFLLVSKEVILINVTNVVVLIKLFACCFKLIVLYKSLQINSSFVVFACSIFPFQKCIVK